MELTDEVVDSFAIGQLFKDYNGRITSMDFHRTEDLLVTACADQSIRVYNTATATCEKTIHSKKYGAEKICFTHHPSSIIYSSNNGWDESLRYLSVYDNRYLRYFKGHTDKVVSLSMSPLDDSFMSGSLDKTVRIWDLKTNICQAMIRVKGRPSVSYDNQGLIFAVGLGRGTIKLFDARQYASGPFKTVQVESNAEDITSMRFSNDGKLLLVNCKDSKMHLLDAFEGNRLFTFHLAPDYDGSPLEGSFSPCAKYIIAGSGDGTLRAWKTSTGQEVARWDNHAGVPAVVRWAPRHLMFASASVLLSFWIPDLTKLTNSSARARDGL